jgi:adenylate cyclase
MAAPAEIIVTGPDGQTQRFTLNQSAMVGRHPECEIVLTDPMSSRRHCKLERTPAGVIQAEDQKSANGTLLNGEPMRPAVAMPLKNGDVVQIGSTTLVLKLEVAARPSMASAPAVVTDEEDSPVSLIMDARKQLVSEEEAQTSDVKTLKKVAERLKLLIDVGQALGTSLELPKLISTCLEKLFEVFPQADRAMIVVYAPDGSLPPVITPESDQNSALAQRKTGLAMTKLRHGGQQPAELKLSRTVLNKVRTEKKSVLIEKSGSMSLVDISSVMCAPLIIADDSLGLIYVETKKALQAFQADDVNILTAVAGQIAVVIRNSDLARKAAEQAAHRESLSRFLSPQLVDQMLKGNISLELGGTEKKGTIFFSDIVGFTKLASKMRAADVLTLLNRYFTVMQNIIFRRGGSIDKCAGDNIMAHWGIIGDMPNFTQCAVTSSVEMQIALFVFNRDESLKKEIKLPPTPLGHGLGLNTGVVCAGNIGSDRKIEFTVIGDPVNLSARIEAMAGRFQTFVGEPTFEEIKTTSLCFRMPDCPAKNVAHPLPVYCVRAIAPQAVDMPAHNAGDLALDDLLFAMPCVLKAGEARIAGMVARMLTSGGETRILVHFDKALAPNTPVTLEWDIPEKPTLPSLEGVVERCGTMPDFLATTQVIEKGMAQPTAVTSESLSGGVAKGASLANYAPPSGMLMMLVKDLPAEIQAFKAGALIPSDLKSHEDIVRA